MKYALRDIFKNRYGLNRTEERKLTERFIPLNVLVKLLSPYPTWLFLNLGIHQDSITFLSFGAILTGSALLVLGYPLAGVGFYLLFGLLDSVDGDMARCQAKKTAYGGILDSFGADFFYALAPLSVGFFLFKRDMVVLSLPSTLFMLVGTVVSVTFILYRLINAKVNNFKSTQASTNQSPSEVAKSRINSNILKRFFRLFRHVLVRGNFFGEPGMIFWFSVLVIAQKYNILAVYLMVILVYNLFYLLTNLVGSYIYFKRSQ